MITNNLIEKAWRVINSCQTPKQAQCALRYLDLLGQRYPDMDTTPFRTELMVLFTEVC